MIVNEACLIQLSRRVAVCWKHTISDNFEHIIVSETTTSPASETSRGFYIYFVNPIPGSRQTDPDEKSATRATQRFLMKFRANRPAEEFFY